MEESRAGEESESPSALSTGDQVPDPPESIIHRILRMLAMSVGVVLVVGVLLALAIEILIAVNARVVGGETDFSLRSDWEANATGVLELPGAGAIPVEAEPAAGDTAAWRDWLVRRHSPVILQLLGHHPKWDLPVAIDFDGNEDPRDNPRNAEREYPSHASLYGELTAITTDSYYLTYSLYHLRDYDHPVREVVIRTSHHDGDNEGLHLRVDRETLQVEAVETWYHNRFVLCDGIGESAGTDPVLGRLHLEGGTHPILYAQDLGHGIRCAQMGDTIDLARTKVFRPALNQALTALTPSREPEYELTYELLDFDRWYYWASADPAADSSMMFVGRIQLNEGLDAPPLTAVQYIAGSDREDISHWSRPKPMWAWDDIWDGIPIASWHFLPSYSFATRIGSDLSHEYEMNLPADRLFGLTGNELAEQFSWDPGSAAGRVRNDQSQVNKWQNFDPGLQSIERKHYWWAAEQLLENFSASVQRVFNRYVTRVFANLG